MKKTATLMILSLIIILYACCPNEKKAEKSSAPIIGKKELKLSSDIMTPEVLWSFGRISEPVVSPDNQHDSFWHHLL